MHKQFLAAERGSRQGLGFRADFLWLRGFKALKLRVDGFGFRVLFEGLVLYKALGFATIGWAKLGHPGGLINPRP